MILISDLVRTQLPQNIIDILIERFPDDSPTYNISSLKVFNAWCKRYCPVDILHQYILPCDEISLSTRRRIVSYFMSTRRAREVSSEDLQLISPFYDILKEQRKDTVKKRDREYRVIENETKKARYVSPADTQCVIFSDGTSISIDTLSLCLSFLPLHEARIMRMISKGFLESYIISNYHIFFDDLTDRSIIYMIMKIIYYLLQSPDYPNKRDLTASLICMKKAIFEIQSSDRCSSDRRYLSIFNDHKHILSLFEGRIHIGKIDVSVVYRNMCYFLEYTPTIYGLLNMVGNLTSITDGICMRYETSNDKNPGIELGNIQHAISLQWISLIAHPYSLVTIVYDLEIRHIYLPQVRHIILESPEPQRKGSYIESPEHIECILRVCSATKRLMPNLSHIIINGLYEEIIFIDPSDAGVIIY